VSPNERSILVVTCFGHFMSHFNMLLFPAMVLPLTRHFGMDLALIVPLSFLMYLLYGVTALPWGMLTDRIGAKPLLYVFFAGAGASGLVAGLAMEAPYAFSLALGGVGLFSGIYHPAGLGLISRGIERMSMGLGYNGIAGNAGLACAPLTGGVVNYFFGTQAVFFFLGGMNLLGGLLMLALPLHEPAAGPQARDGDARRLMVGFLILCACMIMVGIVYRGSTVILPSYFELRSAALFEKLDALQGLVVSRNVAATALTSLVFVAGMGGQYVGGRVAERFDPRRGYIVFHSLAVPLALGMGYAMGVPLFLISAFFFFAILGMQPIENTLVARLTPDRMRHSAFGTKFILNFGIGSFAVHLVGVIESAWSLPAVFVLLAGCSLVIVALASALILLTRPLRM
jgi:MFS family permease